MTNEPTIDLADAGCRESLRLEQRYFQAFNQQARELEERLAASKQELDGMGQFLAQKEKDLELCRLQLMQAQDELDFNLHYLKNLEQFQHRATHSLKMQLKLLSKTLLSRLVDQLKWVLPAQQLQRHKDRLRAILQRL